MSSRLSLVLLIIVTTTLSPMVANAQQFIYWTDAALHKIARAGLNGCNVEDLVTGEDNPRGLALDLINEKMYWTETHPIGAIERANLDGSNVESLITSGLGNPQAIALDLNNSKMYFTDHQGSGNKIKRANLDGSNVQDLVTGSRPWGIALDLQVDKMYWTDSDAGKIQRANLNGSNIEDLITGLSNPHGIALDLNNGKIYWTETGKIRRGDLNGGNVTDLLTTADGLIGPEAIALDLNNGKIYWTDNGTDKIQRADLNGDNVEDLITSGLDESQGIALELGIADHVEIMRAIFLNSSSLLLVTATSSDAPNAELFLTVEDCVTKAPMRFRNGQYSFFTRGCTDLGGKTAFVTSGCYGGSATATIRGIGRGVVDEDAVNAAPALSSQHKLTTTWGAIKKR